MDNNTSAYDLSAYEKRKTADNTPELKVVKNENSKKEAFLNAKAFLLGVFVLVIVASTLYNNAIINELGNQILKANQDYAELIGENKKMTAILESKVSLKNVEEYAKENLGLSKMEQYQIEYVNLLPNDKIECIKENKEETISDKIFNRISRFFNDHEEDTETDVKQDK